MAEDTPLYKNPSLPLEARLADLLSRMTLEEKVAQMGSLERDTSELISSSGDIDPVQSERYLKFGIGGINGAGRQSPREGAQMINAVQGFLVQSTRLGIPALVHGECLHGYMASEATSFPQAIALASTWEPALVEQVASVAAHEMRLRGGNHAFSPVLDLARDPRWGRTEETYGEDPCLVSHIGKAFVKGLQGEAPQVDNRHVLATAKHYAAHGQPESGTNAGPANYSERELRQTFLVPFEAAIREAGAHTVMASYNEIDGVPSHVNPWLLRRVLREEWGFRGFVTSDGGAVPQLHTLHFVTANPQESARKCLEAGVDYELAFSESFRSLATQVKDGLVPMALIDDAVRRILRLKFLLGLFEHPYVDPIEAERLTNCPEHRQLARLAAQKAIILLKNEQDMLPLDPSRLKSIAVIGPNAATCHVGGYSYDPAPGVSVLEGIQKKLGDKVDISYAQGCRLPESAPGWQGWWKDEIQHPDPAEDDKLIAEAAATARSTQVALVVVGDNESICREAWSSTHLGDRDSLDLAGRQSELVKAILQTGTPTIVLLINGCPVSIPDIAAQAPAILEGWYLGQETGNAVADVLFGEVNPGGKLPITFPRSAGQLPAFYNHKPSARRGYVLSDIKPVFPFGHGLSYTTFEYTNLRLSPAVIHPAGQTLVSVDVTNTGSRGGDEVVQLYIRDCVSSLTRPVKELKGFQRITLQPGERRTVQFTLTPKELSFLDYHMVYIVEPGAFDIMVGTSSVNYHTVRLTISA